MEKQFQNVAESRPLYDTISVSGFNTSPNDVDGWFTTFALFGAAAGHYFFNVRNRSVGIAYNNQDKRDALPYAMRMKSFGVTFFAPSIRDLYNTIDPAAADEDVWACDFWEKELPRHSSIEFVVMQDEHIACNSFACPPGYGMVGGGFGRGYATTQEDITSYPTIKGHVSQGVPEMGNRWPFPGDLDVPRDGNIFARVQFSEWARNILQTMTGPGWIVGPNSDGSAFQGMYANFGIQVSIFGEALIQQRGEYHRL
jgi:hypothetical protein